ncbi:hypothetical protein OSB04_031232 [Centaurea solstitialis]|uniref:Uncharacterized protein n=1 Tax=Centaurea solstitialis TaxID=347529 RepID=A0AA38S8K6_9ASTR|nr:hypothetical protein OSB04_031232 [Centaurea solstitialis]
MTNDGSTEPMVETKSCPIPGLTEEQYASFLKLFGKSRKESVIANMAGIIRVDDDWVVDIGAIEHITYQRHLLDNLSMNTTEKPITIPNEESFPIKGKEFSCTKFYMQPFVGSETHQRSSLCSDILSRFLCFTGFESGELLIGTGDCRGGL